MARFPAFMFFADAYWLDASHLNDAEHGIYMQLMILNWRSPECRIPNDDAWIARQMRRSVEAVKTDVRPILQEFFSSDGNWLFQKRLREEHKRLVEHSKNQSVRAKSRWKKKKPSSGGNAETMPAECDPHLDPHSTKNVEESNDSPTPPAAPSPASNPLDDPAKLAFDSGVRLLTKTGMAEARARSMVGRWRKAAGNERVIDVFSACHREGPTDPVAWITAALRERGRGPPARRGNGNGRGSVSNAITRAVEHFENEEKTDERQIDNIEGFGRAEVSGESP